MNNMYYTFYRDTNKAKEYNFAYESLFNNNMDLYKEDDMYEEKRYKRKNTILISSEKIKNLDYVHNTEEMIRTAAKTGNELFPNGITKDNYNSFKIPKRSGGLRQIDAPKDDLMEYLSNLKQAFERCNILWHNSAFAYTKQRTALSALREHQTAESKWFLKLDVEDFFPSCNAEVIFNQLTKIYPFALFSDESKENLKTVISFCLLENKLPQGTPMSPLITNLIMVPFDYTIVHTIRKDIHSEFIYTRYADDLLISCKYDFEWKKVTEIIDDLFQNLGYPFKLKAKKTRYGSSAGSNWNLGLMLNKDNNITIGYKTKKRLKAMIFSFFLDLTNNKTWSIIDTQVLTGKIAYYKMIEPDYIKYVTDHYNKKFNKDFDKETKKIIRGDYLK